MRQNFDVLTSNNQINNTEKNFHVKRNVDIKQYYSYFSVKKNYQL